MPDKPVVMHDLNLEEMMLPRFMPQLEPTGKIKVQFQLSEDKMTLTVIIIEVNSFTSSGFRTA